jgi:hypothetical protein
MKIYYRGRYVKNVPAEFAQIPDLPDYFEDLDSTRLSAKEWWFLKMALFHQRITPFLDQLAIEKPDTFRKIEKSSPQRAFIVKSDDGQRYYSLLFRNGNSVRIPKRVYSKCPCRNKREVSYPNSFVAAPPVQQLKLF